MQSYENSLKYYRDLKNSIDTAFDEGKLEGRLEGHIEGKIEGEQIGIKKGKIETARAMKAKGLEISVIAEVTGLAVTEIERL
jgi:predicted transposase/invertase (TIGR01784 family)